MTVRCVGGDVIGCSAAPAGSQAHADVLHSPARRRLARWGGSRAERFFFPNSPGAGYLIRILPFENSYYYVEIAKVE